MYVHVIIVNYNTYLALKWNSDNVLTVKFFKSKIPSLFGLIRDVVPSGGKPDKIWRSVSIRPDPISNGHEFGIAAVLESIPLHVENVLSWTSNFSGPSWFVDQDLHRGWLFKLELSNKLCHLEID